MTNDYDEDLNQNPFFKIFLQNYADLFTKCVQEGWLICVPRQDSLPKYTFTLEDFRHHILKPLNCNQELKANLGIADDNTSIGNPISTLSRNSSCSNLSTRLTSSALSEMRYIRSSQQRKWNFRTLAEVNIEYSEKVLFTDSTDCPMELFSGLDSLPSADNNLGSQIYDTARAISVLFDETFYTVDKQKYKILCISTPLNSHIVSDSSYSNTEERNPGMWNLSSLRDCIDFLWINGRPKTLETFDAYIKLFLHNHRSLEDLPLPVQRDLVYDLYKRCLTSEFKLDSKYKKLKGVPAPDQYSWNETVYPSTTSSGFHVSHSTQNFQLATETYVLNGIYRQLITGISSSVSFEDSMVNKVMRNVADIQPQDLGISNIYSDNLSRARQELGRLSMHGSPLGKLKCLFKTMKYLKLDRTFDEVKDKSEIISTDELLPIWVYLIVKTPIGNWTAQLQFLRQFRFSSIDTPENESSFFIVTLEAALLYLNSGRISGGLSESERDVGTPYQDYVGEFWLRCLFNTSEDESLLGELFSAIRQGNLEKLEELINDYDMERKKQEETKLDPLDDSKLCHPLCNCPNCGAVIHPETEPRMKSVFELRNEDCGLTLLHVACVYGRPKVVDFLLASGAQFESQDSQGLLPLHYAASRGHQNALLLLLHAGCPIEPTDHSLNTPLHLASMNGHESCVKALVYYAEHSKKNLNVSAKNCNGDTSLHFASRYGFLGIVQLLVESGASISVMNARQRSPMDIAHNIHVSRILQRSLRRRSLIHKSHGDFVNVEMVKKGETEGHLMLISDPIPHSTLSISSPLLETAQDAMANVTESNKPRIRRSSSLSAFSGTVTRKTSTVVTPSFTPTIMEGKTTDISRRGNESTRPRKERHLYIGNVNNFQDNDSGEMVFDISNIVPDVQLEPNHLLKVCVDNLEYAPHILAEMAIVGAKRKREFQERGLRKVFSAIEIGDIPLALFYLGIPSEELGDVDGIEPGDSAETDQCHPLCPCTRCAAKSAGLLCKLGLDLNVMNPHGLTFLHLAVISNNHSLVKILLKYGADMNIRSTNSGKTALEYAKERFYEDISVTLQLWKSISATPDALT